MAGAGKDNDAKTVAHQQETPDRCPLCGSGQVLEAVVGFPDSDFDTSRYVSLGCLAFPEWGARWHCGECGHSWGLPDPGLY